jgi:hypothetical protein
MSNIGSTYLCFRYKVPDAHLYREQNAPLQMYSRRWQSMDMVDIQEWASKEMVTLQISNISIDAPFELRVRKFVPVEGDVTDRAWFDKTTNSMRVCRIPPYAIASMAQASEAYEKMIESNVANYVTHMVGNLDRLVWDTYREAFLQVTEAQVRTCKVILHQSTHTS